MIGSRKKMVKEPIVYGFDEVDYYEYQTIGAETVTKKKGGITRAVVGGAIAGPVGAIVGSSTAKTTSVTTSGTEIMIVHFSNYAGKSTQESDKFPRGFAAFLDRCIADAKQKEQQESAAEEDSMADEPLKLKDYDKTLAPSGYSMADETLKLKDCDKTFAPSGYSMADEILKLKGLVDQGIITEEEFQAVKKKILGIE